MDTSSIISSALSARSSRSKPSNNINNSDSSHAGPSKNTLSIRLAESAVFLRTNDSTGRNRYNDSRPTMLRGLLTLELVKPTRINRIVLELAAKSITVWPEGTHGRDVPLTESHKVFSSTETVFSAIVSSQDAESFLVLDDNSIDIFDSLPSSPTGSIGGWMSPDVRSIRSQTSGTVTPRRAMSVDSSWTRRPAPVSVPPLPIPIPNSPPPYSPDAVNDDNNNDNRDSVNSTSHVYEESRITFQPGVHGSREHAPNSSSGRRSRSKPTRSAPQEPLPPLPPLPHPYASNPTTSRPHMVARGPLVSSDFIASPSPVMSPPVEEEEEGPSPTGIDAYEYAQAHARAHAQTQITPTPSMYFRSQYTPSTHAHNDETEELSRGRKKSRFSLAALGSRLVKAVRSRSRSKSKGPAKDVTTQAHRDPSQSSYSSRPSSSGVSTRSGVSGISGSSAASIATTNTTDSKKRRSLSLPWKRKRKTTTVDMEEEEGRGRVRERMSTSSRPGEAELGVLDISSSSTPRSNNSINSHSAASSFASPPPSIRTDRRASSSSRSIADSQAPSHISFAPSSFRTPSPSPRSPTNSGANENPRWKDFAKGTYTYPILFQIPGHAPPTLDTSSSHQKPLSSLSDTYLPQSTLRWQLKASVHRPGAFASKMQVTQEVLVVSGPGEDDGEDGVNGETVVVERTWDGGVPLLHGAQPNMTPSPSAFSTNPNPGSLQYLIAISGRCFCIGGVIPIELTLMPLDKVRVHRLGVTLEQKIEYHTQFKRVARTDPVLSIPLLSVKEEKYQSKEKVKELKHILPLESDDPEALRKSPLWDVMRRSLLERMRESEVEEEEEEDDDEDDLSYDSDASQPQSRISPDALSELASNLMGPGPWSVSLALPLPLAHSSNLTPEEELSGLGKKDKSKVDIGRGLLPSNKNRRSNVTISHFLKCVIRVERPEPVAIEEEEEQEVLVPSAQLASGGRSGQDGRESKTIPASKPKKKAKLFDIVVQTPVQILSCRCNLEFASLPGYTEDSSLDIQSQYSESIPLDGLSSISPSISSAGAGLSIMAGVPAASPSDCCPCVMKARMKQVLKEQREVQKEQRRERIRERRERREEEERRKKKEEERRKRDRGRLPGSPPTAPLPPPPPLAPPPLMPLPPPPPTTIEQYTQKKSKISSQQRMSFSSGSTSTSSAYSMHPALMRNNNNRTSGLSGLGRASVERRQTNQSISSRDGSFRAGGGLKVPQEFEDLVAGHMNETGEAPPTYNQLLQEACLRTNGGKYGARGGRVTVVSSEDVEL